MDLAQMEAIAVDLDKRVTALERQKLPAAFAPQNDFYINNTTEVTQQTIDVTEIKLEEGRVYSEGGLVYYENAAGEKQPIDLKEGYLESEKEELFYVNKKKEKTKLGGGGATYLRVGCQAREKILLHAWGVAKLEVGNKELAWETTFIEKNGVILPAGSTISHTGDEKLVVAVSIDAENTPLAIGGVVQVTNIGSGIVWLQIFANVAEILVGHKCSVGVVIWPAI